MTNQIDATRRYGRSPDVVTREIEGEVLIIPITSGVGDLEEELYSLNDFGREIWNHLDGTRSLEEIAREFEGRYEAASGEILEDMMGFVGELFKRRMVVDL